MDLVKCKDNNFKPLSKLCAIYLLHRVFKEFDMDENEISKRIINCSINIHRELGPGLLESVYENILAHELRKNGLNVQQQKTIPVIYDQVTINEGFRADLIVNDKVIVEVKSVKELEPVHSKQLLTYLKFSNKKLGLLLNFNKALLKGLVYG